MFPSSFHRLEIDIWTDQEEISNKSLTPQTSDFFFQYVVLCFSFTLGLQVSKRELLDSAGFCWIPNSLNGMHLRSVDHTSRLWTPTKMMDKYSHICSMVLEYLAPAPRSIWDRNMKICIKTLVESAGMQPFRAFYGSVQRKFGSKLGWGVGDSVLRMPSLGFPCFQRNWISFGKIHHSGQTKCSIY